MYVIREAQLSKYYLLALLCTRSGYTAVGYLLDSSLCDRVGRLRVFEQLEDLLKSLLIWLPLHPEKHKRIHILI